MTTRKREFTDDPHVTCSQYPGASTHPHSSLERLESCVYDCNRFRYRVSTDTSRGSVVVYLAVVEDVCTKFRVARKNRRLLTVNSLLKRQTISDNALDC
jgi:hypothetical protein